MFAEVRSWHALLNFKNNSIIIHNCKLSFTNNMFNTKITALNNSILYEYKGVKYSLDVSGGSIKNHDNLITIEGENIILTPTKL